MSIPEEIDLSQHFLLDKSRTILVGVSGGTDSLSLLHLLVTHGYAVVVAHFNHHLRTEAAADAAFVQEVADQLRCPFVRGDEDVAAIALVEKTSIETAARHARYQFLFAQAEKLGAQAVAVGHTADDQVETVLLHILRGSGLQGIAGMRPRSFLKQYSRTIPLVRPLLLTWRYELESYCADNRLFPRQDQTNVDATYTRNRIRNQLIPVLEEFNPKIKVRLLGLSIAARSSLDALEESVEEQFQQMVRSSGSGFTGFDRAAFARLPEGMRQQLVLRAVQSLKLLHEDIGQVVITRAADLPLSKHRYDHTDLADGIEALVDGDRFYLKTGGARILDDRYPQVQPDQVSELGCPGNVYLADGWVLSANLIEAKPGKNTFSLESDPMRVYIDADILTMPLSVRSRRAGDRFQPLGLETGRKTLGEFFTDLKIPRTMREYWPLVLSGDQIIWVAGLQIAEQVKVKTQSRRLVCLSLLKIQESD